MPEPFEIACAAVREAGAILLEHFGGDFEVTEKSPGDPVTTADLAADRCLKQRLLTAFPDYGWLSEETADNPARLTCDRVWIVDPLDGTREFVRGIPEFAVSVGLTEAGRPILGIVFNPVSGEFFAGYGKIALLNGQPLRCSSLRDLRRATIIVSRSEQRDGLWSPGPTPFSQLQSCGSSAYKLALVAAGRADLTISLRHKTEWDVCAGDLLLTNAGAMLVTGDGHALRYNQADPRLHPPLLAGPQALVSQIIHQTWITPI